MKKLSILSAFAAMGLFMIFPPCCFVFAEQNLFPNTGGIKEAKETEKKGSGMSEEGKSVKGQDKGSVEAGKSDVSPQALDEQKKQPVLDRRWIIKMRDEKNKKIVTSTPVQTAWSGKEQKSLCETYLARLRESFRMTRHYSIHGDSCSTARNARVFLDFIEQCSRDCPEGYAGSKGYSAKAIQNVEVLLELGRKRCFQAVTESGPVKSESRPGNAESQNTTRKEVQQRDRN
ncbi:MAG: hypothetical protein CVU57_13850 [Deltaproteobacteria bacterium HGW-Deltaproteobacteria-15]|jgi:hypothetical protein|nr:MAG: hypothetical protein CVU57_13850 [Deltaproteobacteria bacterium HGW-Deltaproteobacteria-15]